MNFNPQWLLGNSKQKHPTLLSQSISYRRHLSDKNLVLLVHIVLVDNKIYCFSASPQSLFSDFTSIMT